MVPRLEQGHCDFSELHEQLLQAVPGSLLQASLLEMHQTTGHAF